MVAERARIVPGNAQHLGSRGEQQDAFGFSDPGDEAFLGHGGFLAVVADGMGGLAQGRAASAAAVRAFLAAYARKTRGEAIPEALRRGVREANAAVLAAAREGAVAGRMGTTLVAVVLAEPGMYWVSVGDSALYLYRDGHLTLITTPHVYASQLGSAVAAGLLSREAALADPERESLTSYVGVAELGEMDLSLRPLPLSPGDVAILCSDGLFKTLDLDEMASVAAGDPQHMADALVRRAVDKELPHQDNVTVLTVGLAMPVAGPRPAAVGGAARAWLWGAIAASVLLATALGAWRLGHLGPGGPSASQPADPVSVAPREASPDSGAGSASSPRAVEVPRPREATAESGPP